MEQISLNWEVPRRLFTVSELTAEIRELLGAEFEDIWVAGEISGAKKAASGHLYFVLKDKDAQLKCVCYKGTARLLRFRAQDGIAVVARGRIDVYETRGEYQLLVTNMEPQGYGALQLAFEQLKRKLEAEGLFAAGRKKPLPKYPRRIGVVTSRDGAAIRDIINVLTRRFPGIHIRLYPAIVQGEGSTEQIVEGIEHFSQSNWADLVIVGRGGGSLEDLWTFNEEAVARAIAACRVPVISAVGHETDFTIADFVADLRAPTPSAAAEMAIVTREELLDRIRGERPKLERIMRYRLAAAAARVERLSIEGARGALGRRIGRYAQRVDDCEFRSRECIRDKLRRSRLLWLEVEERLRTRDLRLALAKARRRLERAISGGEEGMLRRLAALRARLEPLAAQLQALSPLQILERGYSIVQDPNGAIVRDSAQAPPGAEISVRLHKGRLAAAVLKAWDGTAKD